MSPKRKKLKAVVVETGPAANVVYDRRATDLPLNARVATTEEEDAFGFPSGAIWNEKRGEWYVPERQTVQLLVSLRDDPLRQLLVRGQISRQQYDGGRWYQARYECQLGGVRSLDPGKEAVDGGRLPEPLTEHVQLSIQELAVADRTLGIEGQTICRGILGQGHTIGEFARTRGMERRSDVEYIGRRFRECLVTLAVLCGVTTGVVPTISSVRRAHNVTC
jgi:hypothetical protein